jgi:archaellum component FlaC
MVDLEGVVLGLVSGLVVGTVVGFIVEHLRLKNMLKIERVKRLAPQLELVHPVLEKICDDVSYLRAIQSRNDDFEDLTRKTCQSFEEYQSWYNTFRENGLKPQLEHSSKDLYALINGVSVHAQMVTKYGVQHLLANIEDISKKVNSCRKGIATFLNQ